ncbi:DUF5723 family protein [Flavobacteriales bacterium]|nr:DUF5723 family protein [Flavobacteriales bacterium]MDB4088334.1 DUF5723 family protein [Flavobacteriales bacterium]
MIKIKIAFLLLLTSTLVLGQGEGSVFNSTGRGVSTTFATDYQALGINPANLGWSKEFKGKTLAFGLGETGFSASSKLFNNPFIKDIRSFPLSFDVDGTKSYNEFSELSSDLQDGLSFNLDSRLFGIAITTKRLGGFAFTVTERYSMNIALSKDFADIFTYGFAAPLFDSLVVQNGSTISTVENTPSNYDSLNADPSSKILLGKTSNPKSVSELLNGTKLKVSWIREFNFGYGRQIIKNDKFGIYGGIGIKYLTGMALFDLESSPTDLKAFLSYSPSFTASGLGFFSTGSFKLQLPKAAGKGYGVDLGVNIKAFKRLKIGFAVNDIGSITWKENTFSAVADTALTNFQIGGLTQSPTSGTSGTASFDSILNSLVVIQNGNFERKVSLPSNLRAGASIQLGKMLEFGIDMIAPLNTSPGNFKSALFSAGADFKLGPLKLSGGIVFQNEELLRIPVGFVFTPVGGRYEMGISTRDINSIIKFKETEKPMISAAFGFLRFRI